MAEPSLETLDARVAALEHKGLLLAGLVPPSWSWQSVVGMHEETEFSRHLLAEIEAAHEAERAAARESGRGVILLDTDQQTVLRRAGTL